MGRMRLASLCALTAALLFGSPLRGASPTAPPPPPPLGATAPANVCSAPPLPPGIATPQGSVGFFAYASVEANGTVATTCGSLVAGHNVTSVKRVATGLYDVTLATNAGGAVCVVSPDFGGEICKVTPVGASGSLQVTCARFAPTKNGFAAADSGFSIQCMAPR